MPRPASGTTAPTWPYDALADVLFQEAYLRFGREAVRRARHGGTSSRCDENTLRQLLERR